MPEQRSPLSSLSPCNSAVEPLVGQFESLWLKGARPDIAAFLTNLATADRQRALVELVHAELEFRLKAGEPARVEEYLRRFPELRDRAILAALVHAEYRLRHRAEATLSWAEFSSRFPEVPEPTEPTVSAAGSRLRAS